ncbi:MAG: hypothetical protein AAFZ15_04525 [Bacteroidota bacterium]
MKNAIQIIEQLPSHVKPLYLIVYDSKFEKTELVELMDRKHQAPERATVTTMLEKAKAIRDADPAMGWRKVKRLIGYPYSYVTLIRHYREYFGKSYRIEELIAKEKRDLFNQE